MILYGSVRPIGAEHHPCISRCADIGITPIVPTWDCADVVLGRADTAGLEADEVGTILEAVSARAWTELRYRELTCEAMHRWPEGGTSSVPALSFSSASPRIGDSRQVLRAIAPRRRSTALAPGEDCADVACRNVSLRKVCRVKVGTIPRSAQSAIARDLNCCMPCKGIPGAMASRSLLGGPIQYKGE